MPIIQTAKQLRPRDEYDFYPTPLPFALAALERIDYKPTCILDIGAGAGVWGEAARMLWTGITVTGIELRDVPRPKAYDFWLHGDMATFAPVPAFDLVMANPPYRDAEKAVRMGYACLETDCVQVHLLRLAFLEGQARGAGLYRESRRSESTCVRRDHRLRATGKRMRPRMRISTGVRAGGAKRRSAGRRLSKPRSRSDYLRTWHERNTRLRHQEMHGITLQGLALERADRADPARECS